MSIETPADPFQLDLTVAGMQAIGRPPLVAGDTIAVRFQARDDGSAVSLAGATAWWTMRDKEDGQNEFIRRSSAGQIVFDADQAMEDVEAGTGKGWMTVHFTAADQAALLAFVGLLRPWDLRLRLAAPGSEVKTYGRGKVEWLRPRSVTLT